jgi:plasmid stabilization system protein ParE
MASCTVWVAASADATVQRISRWWAKNRPAAPRLFEFELARAIEMIEAHPEIGRWAQHPLHGRVQVLLLRRTEVHVFYKFFPIPNEAGIVFLRHGRRRPLRKR